MYGFIYESTPVSHEQRNDKTQDNNNNWYIGVMNRLVNFLIFKEVFVRVKVH